MPIIIIIIIIIIKKLKRPKREADTSNHPFPRSRMTGFSHTPSWRGV